MLSAGSGQLAPLGAAWTADAGQWLRLCLALWLGLHGLAHQQSVTVSFPWPPDIAERLIVALAHLTDDRG